MKNNKTISILLFLFLIVGLCIGGYSIYDRGRPAPVPMKKKLYEGIIYRRIVHVYPRPMISHVIVIDRKTAKVEFLVTPADTDGELPLNARTTSQFLNEFNLQIAINGDAFIPWWSNSLADFYPHVGDPVTPLGFTASQGDVYTTGGDNQYGTEPTLYLSRQHFPSFNRKPDKIYSAISGDRMILEQGEFPDELEDNTVRHPRTAIGINRNGRYIYLVVVDGRQPLYSNGATYRELAEVLLDQGAFFAMALDGGGSSTLVVEGQDGETVILNSPIDNYIPGRERPVGNHFGVYVNP
jgi:hypothetical protein